ncbi:helix-turn-helix transcriptional regulator [Actinoplanes sp. HUAS TT8]|uniref:helix-turn-helix transcriptional regulator n=1 Tax=Actinoplanes sp. HUAS TT8 TaxID=3447453 RepID=UPI003F52382C
MDTQFTATRPDVDGPCMMGAAEISRRLGLSRQRIQQLAERDDFPKPYQLLAMGRIWLEPEIETWIRDHRD